jgi:cell wall-associated NlpC family hydrolase
MTELEQRQAVANEAMGWLRTPYVSEGRIKGVVADCTFFAKVYEAVGVMPAIAIPHYSPQAHLNRESSLYLDIVSQFAAETDVPQIGDIVLYKIGRGYSHGGVIVHGGWPNIIHADLEARFVVLARGDQGKLSPPVEAKFFTPWPAA